MSILPSYSAPDSSRRRLIINPLLCVALILGTVTMSLFGAQAMLGRRVNSNLRPATGAREWPQGKELADQPKTDTAAAKEHTATRPTVASKEWPGGVANHATAACTTATDIANTLQWTVEADNSVAVSAKRSSSKDDALANATLLRFPYNASGYLRSTSASLLCGNSNFQCGECQSGCMLFPASVSIRIQREQDAFVDLVCRGWMLNFELDFELIQAPVRIAFHLHQTIKKHVNRANCFRCRGLSFE